MLIELTELLLNENPEPPGFTERFFTRVQAYTAGYDREVGDFPHLSTAIGSQITFYGVPDLLKNLYTVLILLEYCFSCECVRTEGTSGMIMSERNC
jgi:hypothetical protein